MKLVKSIYSYTTLFFFDLRILITPFDIFKLFDLVVWKTARILRYTQRACCLCSTQCDISDGELNNVEMDNSEAFGLISGSS
jgi:hypothetical protein